MDEDATPLWEIIELDPDLPPKSEVVRRCEGTEVSCGGGVATIGIGGKASELGLVAEELEGSGEMAWM